MLAPQTEWLPPQDFLIYLITKKLQRFKNQRSHLKTMGSGSTNGTGEIVGIVLAVNGWSTTP